MSSAPHAHLRQGVLAIDVGTSSCRSSLYGEDGLLRAHTRARRAYAPTLVAQGGAEFDAEALLGQVASCIDESLQQAGADVGELALVAPTTFWHSLLGVDAAGRAVTPVYLWMDARSRHHAEALRVRLDGEAVHARTGCVLHWSYAPAKLSWLVQEHPELARRVDQWLSFGEYLLLRFTGSVTPSLSLAAASGLLDQHRLRWDPELLEAIGVEAARLPPMEAATVFHPAPLSEPHRARWPALAQARWLTPLGDGACSNLGAGCTTRKTLALMVGTSGALRGCWRSSEVHVTPGLWCYRLDRERVVLGGSLNDGGILFSWLRGNLGLPPLHELETQMSSMEADSHGLTVLPFWSGERAPGWSTAAKGTILGLTLETTAAAICRASLESIALRFARVESLIRQQIPEADTVVATGGGLLRSPTWLQIMADALGRPIIASDEPEASSRGVALYALDAAGLLPGGLEAAVTPSGPTYSPRPENTMRYRAALERQERLYALLVDTK